jgi:hypothetical protein
MPKKIEEKKPRGRPSKYKPEYCQQLVDFFSGPKNERVKKAYITGKNKYEKTEYETVPCDLPFFSAFARKIGVDHETLTSEWPKQYEDFSVAYNTAKQLQKEFLVTNGLRGLYPPASFIFTAKNITDMRDTQVLEGNPDKPLEIKGNFANPADAKKYLEDMLLAKKDKIKKRK